MSAPALTASAQRLGDLRLPTADEELWRYSRIGDLDLARFERAEEAVDVSGLGSLRLATGSDRAEAADVFEALNHDLTDGQTLTVPAHHVHSEPVVFDRRVVTEGGLSASSLVIEAGENSEITVIERFSSADAVRAVTVPNVEVRLGQAARLRYIAINELGTATWSIGRQLAVSGRDASLHLATIALGGEYARVRAHACSAGIGASTRQTALYFADGRQMHDFRVTQEHVAARTSSDLLFKGAVAGTAASVYTGLIKIGAEGKGTSAYQTNRTLTLSSGAWAESVPNLAIETNDVKCSHASTVGPVDEEQRFYLESRGVPPEIAERLIVLGFFDEVLAQMPLGAHLERLRADIATKLERRVA